MIQSVIIDDNDNSRLTLIDDLKTYCHDIEIVGEANEVKSGIQLIKMAKPDIVFLDIELDGGTGFDILECFTTINFKVIFITAFDSYGIKAIKFSALDYLLKPVDTDELINAIQKYKDSTRHVDMKANIDFLLENIKGVKQGFKRIALNSAERVNMVNVEDIIRCESQSNYTLFYMKGGEQLLVTRSLKEYENMLEEFSFIRVHHSHLINLNYLKEYVKTDGGYAVMSDKSNVPVSVRKKDHLLKVMGL